MKKNLAARLRERTETIEYRSIRAKLNAIAQNKNVKQEYRALTLQPETIVMLQNEGITIQSINEFEYTKLLLTWSLTAEQRLADQIKWNVNFNERFISVPQAQLTEAEGDSYVAELRSLGFHIQSIIA